jgi:hypothetical protein
MTQLAVHRSVGVGEVPDVITEPRLAGLPVPPMGEMVVVTRGSAILRFGDESGVRHKNGKAKTSGDSLEGSITSFS